MKKPQSTSPVLASSAASRYQILRGRFLLVVGSVFLLLLGFTHHGDSPPANLSAVLMTTIGCIGVVWCGIQTLRDWQLQLLSEAEAGRRLARKQARRQRGAEQKNAQILERQWTAARAEAAIEQREQVRHNQNSELEIQAQFRRRRENDLAQETLRISSVPESEMHLELKRIWESRGWHLVTRKQLPEGEGTLPAEELLMINGSGQREVILFLTGGSRVGVSEIELAERQRIESNAQTSCLLSLQGFTPQAVRLVPRFPLTLVEPHLLALWSLTSAVRVAKLD